MCRYHKQHTKYIEYHAEYQTVSGDTIVKSLAKEINFRKLFKNLAIKEGGAPKNFNRFCKGVCPLGSPRLSPCIYCWNLYSLLGFALYFVVL